MTHTMEILFRTCMVGAMIVGVAFYFILIVASLFMERMKGK